MPTPRMARQPLSHLSPLMLVLLTPVLMILSFPDFNFAFLAWIGLTPLFYVLGTQRLSLIRCGFLGLLAGATFFYGTCYWITHSMIHYGGIPSWLAYSLAIIPAIALGAFWAPVAVGVRWAVARLGLVGLVSAPPLWALTEWGRLMIAGLGWNALGYSQALHPHLIHVAQYAGVYGVSFLLVGSSSLLAVGLAYAVKRDSLWHSNLGRAAGALGLGSLVLMLVAGYWAGTDGIVADKGGEDQRLHVLGIQPNVPIEATFDLSSLAHSFDRLISMTERELASPHPTDLVIWPESPLNLSLYREPDVLVALRTLVQRHDVYLMLNVIGETPPDRLHNSVAVFSPDGQVIGEYHKIRLLPFGEYVPLRGVIPFLDQIPALAGDFSPGDKFTVVDMGKARMASFICSESAIPEIPRRLTERGATLLVELTNDNWFGPTAAPRQHLAHTIFRAVENHRDLIRVTNSGVSVHIAPEGNLIGQTGLFEEQSRRWVIHLKSQSNALTFYTRYGDLFILFCASLCAITFSLCLASAKK